MSDATPGPWRRIQGGTTIVGKDGMFVCQTRISNYTTDDREAQANAALICETVATIDRLTAEREGLRNALESCESWIVRWTKHVGGCNGGDECTCGRTSVLHEARVGLADAEPRR